MKVVAGLLRKKISARLIRVTNIEIKKESFRNSFCNFSTLMFFIIFFDMKNPTDILMYMKLIAKTIIGVSWKIYVI
jgi:hypothetical protein